MPPPSKSWQSPFTLLDTDTEPFISDKSMRDLEKEREECFLLLASQKKEAFELNSMLKALHKELPSPHSSLLTPYSSWLTPDSSGYSPPSPLGNDDEVPVASPTERKILVFGNRRPFNPDKWMVIKRIKSHQQKRLADQSDQSWAAPRIQEQEASQQCEPVRILW